MSRVLVLPLLAALSACAGPRPEARSESASRSQTEADAAFYEPTRTSAPPPPTAPAASSSDLRVPEVGEEVAVSAATPASAWDYYRARYDRDGDKSIERSEYTRSDEGFANLDVNEDGVVSGTDFAKRWEGRRRRGGKPGDFYLEDEPQLGQPASELRLRTTDGVELDLERFRGKKPVALVFGSFT